MFWKACKIFLCLTLLTGCLYPFLITEIAQITMPYQANGSLITVDGQVKGSQLLAQPFNNEKYFWPRPSATNFDTLKSGGSQLGPTSQILKRTIKERADKLSKLYQVPLDNIPRELIYSSASGLDPHIDLETAYFQFNHIANKRNLSHEQQTQFHSIIEKTKEGKQWGFLSHPYVNVVKLNQLLDEQGK